MEEKKAWQHGFDLEILKGMEKSFYGEYNAKCASPFSQMKKNNIAEFLENNTLRLIDVGTTALKRDVAKVRSNITMYQDVVIGVKEKGDILFSFLTGDKHKLSQELAKDEGYPSWLFTWAEDYGMKAFAHENGYKYVSGKITTYGEIYSVWFKEAGNRLSSWTREHPRYDKVEEVNIKKLMSFPNFQQASNRMSTKLDELGKGSFTNHYSNYNANKSWSALSLKGYSPDPAFIMKPIEMNDKWKEEHKDKIFTLQDTCLRKEFPDVENILYIISKGSEIHRVRFMKLTPGGGELLRHTDQVDPDSGNNIGKIVRLHVPVVTNPGVEFTSWNFNGEKSVVNMKVGECWMLDTRKPHTVKNNGTTERIHLVVDVKVNKEIRDSMLISRVSLSTFA